MKLYGRSDFIRYIYESQSGRNWSSLVLLIGQQAVAASKAAGLPLVSKQRSSTGEGQGGSSSKVKGKGSKVKGKGEGSFIGKIQEKKVESSTKGTPKKKLLASTMQAAERVEV